MNQLRGNQDDAGSPSTLDKFIKHDYFYKELSSKPQVRFFDGVAPDKSGADPVDAIMDKRPGGGGQPGSEKKRRQFVTSSSFRKGDTHLLNTQTNLQR